MCLERVKSCPSTAPEVACGDQQRIWWLCFFPWQCWLFQRQGCCTLSIGDPGPCWVSQPSSFLSGQEGPGFLLVQGWGSGAAVVRKALPLLRLSPSPRVLPTLGHEQQNSAGLHCPSSLGLPGVLQPLPRWESWATSALVQVGCPH